MKKVRTILALLLCLIVPVQGMAAIAFGLQADCDMKGGQHSQTHHAMDAKPGAASCCKTNDCDSNGVDFCGSCADCGIGSLFVDIETVAAAVQRPPVPNLTLPKLFHASPHLAAIWRPPSLV